jgi:hypothetical protein
MGNIWLCEYVNISLALFPYILNSVSGSLTPEGTVSLSCGGMQIFTCNGTFPVIWTLRGLHGIKTNNNTNLLTSGRTLAMLNERITSIERKNLTSSSTITISGFTAADNGVTVQCTFLKRNGKRKNANVSIGEGVTNYYILHVESNS